MGLYVRRDEQRSKLQERIAADLRAKNAPETGGEVEPTTDMVEKSHYMDGTKSSSGLLGIWLVLGVVGVGVIVWLIVRSS